MSPALGSIDIRDPREAEAKQATYEIGCEKPQILPRNHGLSACEATQRVFVLMPALGQKVISSEWSVPSAACQKQTSAIPDIAKKLLESNIC
jgi:hypothetical protein